MKQILLLAMLIMILGCSTSKKISSIPSYLDGTWTPIQQEISGKSIPKIAFAKQRLTIKDSTYTMVAESTDKGIVRYLGNKMDIYGKEGVNAGKHFTAIFKLENEQLTICYNLAGTSYPDEFNTKDKPAFFLSIFVKN